MKSQKRVCLPPLIKSGKENSGLFVNSKDTNLHSSSSLRANEYAIDSIKTLHKELAAKKNSNTEKM